MSISEFIGKSHHNYRLIPLLSLRFDKSTDVVRGWVDWTRSIGFGDICLIPSGQKWDKPVVDGIWYEKLLASVEAAVDQAAKHGIGVWIFDEWGYPSGTAGGLVCDKEDNRSKKLHVAVVVKWEYLSFITNVIMENSPDNYALGTIDLLNPDAVRRFTEFMHEPYLARLQRFFGSTIEKNYKQ